MALNSSRLPKVSVILSARAPAGEDAGEDEWGLGSVAGVGDLMRNSEGVPVSEENGKQLEAFLEMARKKFGAERKEA